MAINDCPFDNEAELQTWAFANGQMFFGHSILLPGFRITTPAGKHGVPDGFAFNFEQRRWWVAECELLAHGVWPHIAEQVTRFVVAARNPGTLRQVRDNLFETILSKNKEEEVSTALNTTPTRLLQQVELFLEGVSPALTIFIDDTNQDLLDFCDALDIPSEIYRVNKFVVNGQAEYYSPDRNQPVASYEGDGTAKGGSSAFDIINQLGGGEVVSGKYKCYRLHDGRIVKVSYSKLYEKHQYYWYGIDPSSYNQAKALGCSYYIFIMGDEGFVVLPLPVVDTYIQTANITNNPDGTVRHYHVHLTPPPDVALKGWVHGKDIDVSSYFQALD